MSKPVSFQTVIEYVEALSSKEQGLRNAAQTLEAIRTGTAKRGTLESLRADLLSEE
ncbi:hypothetical protein [Fischerella sp. JS2]|uniref:hypothetical protein n=1 Tax=Fischerella sp. JS2 TaxID=2597771 RepID=UPI0028ED42FE|nr:hypothetical protein [Fischerella sp. JS2]